VRGFKRHIVGKHDFATPGQRCLVPRYLQTWVISLLLATGCPRMSEFNNQLASARQSPKRRIRRMAGYGTPQSAR
jgi:hypothetical protein